MTPGLLPSLEEPRWAWEAGPAASWLREHLLNWAFVQPEAFALSCGALVGLAVVMGCRLGLWLERRRWARSVRVLSLPIRRAIITPPRLMGRNPKIFRHG